MKPKTIQKIYMFGIMIGIVLAMAVIIHLTCKEESHISGTELASETVLDYRVLTETTATKISATSSKEEIITKEYVEYAYPSKIEVPQKTYEGLTEDMSKRTHVQHAFPTGGEKDETIYKIYSGTRSQFYDNGSKWVEIATATTTIENFEDKTSISVMNTNGMWVNWFIKEVWAADYPTGAGDGQCGDGKDGTTWADEWGSADCYGCGPTATASYAPGCSTDGSTYTIQRDFNPADTSGIGAGQTVTAATFNFYGTGGVYNDDGGGNGYFVLVATTQANTATLATTDFDEVGSTPLSETLALSSQTTNQYNAYTLIQAGYDAIDVTGTTKIGARTGFDINNIACLPTFNEHAHRTQEYTGTDYDPYYTITAEAAVTDSCTCPQDGTDWYVDGSDDCYLDTSCDLDGGGLYLLGDGTFSIIDNAVLSVSGVESTGTDMFIKAGCKINFKWLNLY